MSRELSNELLAQLYYQESNDPFLMLLTFEHPDLTTIRLVNNQEDITSRSKVFSAFPFKVALPTDDGESAPQVELILDNASLELMEDFRSITTPATIKIEAVLASLPDIVEIEVLDLELKSINYNQSQITATLTLNDFLSTEIPGESYDPTLYRGLFA